MASSRVSCASFNLGTNTTITITRDKSSYTHTLKYNFNGATGTIVTKTTQTSYVWTPPASTFYSKIPNTTSGYGTVTCETYDGNTLIGTTTAGFYAYAVKSNCVPTVTGTVVDTNASTIALTGDASKMVCYLSKPKATLTATAKNSATIRDIQIENPVGLVATTSPYTFSTVYSDEFKFKAIDSRGYSTTTSVKTGFVEYYPCYLTQSTVARTESTSTTATATIKGDCFNGNFGVANNTLTLKHRRKTSSGTYGSYTTITPTWNSDGTFTATATLTGLSLTESYVIEFVVEDKLTSFPVEVQLNQGIGDLRIAQDYIRSKNIFIVGDKNDTTFKSYRAERKVGTAPCYSELGVSDEGNIAGAVLQLIKNGDGRARIDLKEDTHLYNHFTNMSFAEILASSPTMANDGARGYALLNGGNSSPILLQWGKFSKVPEQANVATSQPVSFLYPFSGIPVVFMTALSLQGGSVEVSPEYITQDGFTAYLRRINVANTPIHWVAIGNGTNALPE